MRRSWRVGLACCAVAAAGLAAWALGVGGRSRDDLEPSEPRASGAPLEAADHRAGGSPQGPAASGGPRLTPAAPTAPRGVATLRGRAVLTSGQPARGADVSARLTGSVERTTVRADAEGNFIFEGLVEGHHILEATVELGGVEYGGEGMFLTGFDAVLTLPRHPGGLILYVTDPEGAPVPAFRARWVRPPEVQELIGRVDPPGVLRVTFSMMVKPRAVLAGAWIEVWEARDASGRGLALAPKRVGPLVGDERKVSLRLEASPVLTGLVVGPDGPVAGAEVCLMARSAAVDAVVDSDGGDAPEPDPDSSPANALTPFEGIASCTLTGPDGAFRVAVPDPEAGHRVSVAPPREYVRPPETLLPAGESSLTIRVERGVRARIKVDASGAPVLGALVHVSAPDDKAPAPTIWNSKPYRAGSGAKAPEPSTAEDGVVTLAALPSGSRHVLHVHVPGDERFGARKIVDWQPHDTKVALPGVFAVSGEVRDARDRPVRKMLLRLEGEAYAEDVRTDEEGRFTFSKVPAGKVSIVRGGRAVSFEDQEVADDESWATRGEIARLDVDVTKDMKDVRVRLLPTRWVTVFLPDASSASGGGARALFTRIWQQEGEAWTSVAEGYLVSGLHVAEWGYITRVAGLDPQRVYRIWTQPTQGRYAEQTFGVEGVAVVLEPRTGGVVQGRVRGLPPGARSATLVLRDKEGRAVGPIETDAEGRFEVQGLPESTWYVQAWYASAGTRLYAGASARTGATLELTLEAFVPRGDDGPVEEQEVVPPGADPNPPPGGR